MEKPIIKVFISYAQDYPDWAIDGIVKRLRHLKRNRENDFQFDFWYDQHIRLGTSFDPQILENLEQADIVLLLVTQEFFFSDYIQDYERPIIERKCDAGESVIPVIIEKTNYYKEWISHYRLPTIPGGPDDPLANYKNTRADKWVTIDERISQAINGKYQVQLSRIRQQISRARIKTKNEQTERVGCGPLLLFLLCMTVISLSAYSIITPESEIKRRGADPSLYSRDNQLGNLTSRKHIGEESENTYSLPERNEDVDNSFDDTSLNSYEENKTSPRISSLNEQKKSYQSKQIRKTPKSGAKYGIYESCQAYDENGFRPCKRGRRWYIVNESKQIHHMINLPVRVHKDIYAIRPFRNRIANVFYYDNNNMYLEFCVNLDDQIVDCIYQK